MAQRSGQAELGCVTQGCVLCLGADCRAPALASSLV